MRDAYWIYNPIQYRKILSIFPDPKRWSVHGNGRTVILCNSRALNITEKWLFVVNQYVYPRLRPEVEVCDNWVNGTFNALCAVGILSSLFIRVQVKRLTHWTSPAEVRKRPYLYTLYDLWWIYIAGFKDAVNKYPLGVAACKQVYFAPCGSDVTSACWECTQLHMGAEHG